MFDRIWEQFEHAILSLTVILMSLLLVGNALSRFFLNRSWAFTEEIGKIGVVVITFIGVGYAARKGMHIEMSGFYDMMSERWQRNVSLLINFGSALILGIFTYLSILYVQHLYDLGQVTTILRFPLYITMIVIPIGFLFGTIRYAIDFIKVLTNKKSETNLHTNS
mgnify:FL=1|jgi:C4-dicarboxylate transporter DctQ subunit